MKFEFMEQDRAELETDEALRICEGRYRFGSTIVDGWEVVELALVKFDEIDEDDAEEDMEEDEFFSIVF